MGYRIQYGKVTKKEREAVMRVSKRTAILKRTAVGCLVIAMVLLGKFGFLDFIIPGDREVTKQAFQTMLEEVQEGQSVKTAFTAFCGEILDGANEK